MRGVFQLIAVFVAACALVGPARAQDKPQIIAVNYALQSFAADLVGDAAQVVYPVPDGVDPSFWRPSIADISAIQGADLILLNGAGFATWTSRVSLPRSKLVDTTRSLSDAFIVTESITHSHGDGGEHSHEGLAAYTWLDLRLAQAQAQAIADALGARGLADVADIDVRLTALHDRLEELDTAARDRLQIAEDIVIITTHPRYQYLARAYGLTIHALEWEAGAMPSAEDLADLEKLVVETGATVLIWEADPPAEAQAAVVDLGLENAVFPPLATPSAAGDFVESFSASLDALIAAIRQAGSG